MPLPAGLTIEQLLAAALVVPADGNPSVDLSRVTWGAPVHMWGKPGVGKTSRVRSVSSALGLPFEFCVGAVHPPEDFSGVPTSDGQGGFHLVPVLRAARNLAGKDGVLVLDEVGEAPGAVQAVLLRVVLDRAVGDLDLGGRCRVLAASNPPDVSATGHEMVPALANRFVHVDVDAPEASEWSEWLLSDGADAAVGGTASDFEKRVVANWPDAWAKARGIVVGFIRRRPDLLYMIPQEGSPDRGRAYPTPRSWALATRCLATSIALHGADPMAELLRDALVAGCVGAGAAGELATFIVEARLPEPLDVLEGRWQPDPNRLDVNAAVVTSVAAYVTSRRKDDPAREDLAAKAWGVYKVVLNHGQADIIVPTVKTLISAGLWNSPKVSKAANEVLSPLSRGGLVAAMTRGTR